MFKQICFMLLILTTSAFSHTQSLTFLQEETKMIELSSEPQILFNTYQDVEVFLTGFIQGVGVLNNLPSQEECATKINNPKIVESVINIIYLVGSINEQSNFVQVFRQVSENITIILRSIEESQSPCRNTLYEAIQYYWQVVQYVQAEGYLQKVQQHALLNLGLLFDKAEKGTVAFKTQNYQEAGILYGEFVNLGLLWDVKL